MSNLKTMKVILLHTHCRLDAFIGDHDHVSVREGWPDFTDEKAEVWSGHEHGDASGEVGIQP